MLPSFILSLREGIEAALVIGIVLACLRQIRQRTSSSAGTKQEDTTRGLVSAVWAGTGSAALVSLLAAVLLTSIGLELKDPGEAIFESITMLLAAGILTWMIFWMSRHSRYHERRARIQRFASLAGREMVAFRAGFYCRPARGGGTWPCS